MIGATGKTSIHKWIVLVFLFLWFDTYPTRAGYVVRLQKDKQQNLSPPLEYSLLSQANNRVHNNNNNDKYNQPDTIRKSKVSAVYPPVNHRSTATTVSGARDVKNKNRNQNNRILTNIKLIETHSTPHGNAIEKEALAATANDHNRVEFPRFVQLGSTTSPSSFIETQGSTNLVASNVAVMMLLSLGVS